MPCSALQGANYWNKHLCSIFIQRADKWCHSSEWHVLFMNFPVSSHFRDTAVVWVERFSCACIISPLLTISLGWAPFHVLAWPLHFPPFFWAEPIFVCLRDFSVVHHFLGWAAFRVLSWFLRCPPFLKAEPLFVCLCDFSVVHHFFGLSRFSFVCLFA